MATRLLAPPPSETPIGPGAAFSNTGGDVTYIGLAAVLRAAVIYTASAFTNAASGDFSLNAAAGGGALLKALGFPGVFPLGLTTGYSDIGAAQAQADAGTPYVIGG